MLEDSSTSGQASTTTRQKRYSPLSLVALFFGLVEIGLAYSSGVSSGYVRIAVLVFMGLFAIGVAATFFVFLWHRNWVFYPPSEFSSPSVQAYVTAMRGPNVSISQVATDEVSRAFADDALLKRLQAREVPEEQRALVGRVVSEIRNEVIENVAAAVLHIDARPLKGPTAPVWEEPYDEKLTVSRLLGGVWLRIQPLAPYGYGTVWALRDASSGRFLLEAAPGLGAGGTTTETGKRGIGEVGIVGGMKLEVVPKS